MKILVDHNLRPSIFQLLIDFGFEAESAAFNLMQNFTNGKLCTEAYNLGFNCILTQDKTFQIDAARVLDSLPSLSIILVDTKNLPQVPSKTYLERFQLSLRMEPFQIVLGKMTVWPKKNWAKN